MGTRNLTAVYMNGEYKIAQYGQWDGYPGGQGSTALNFCRNTASKEHGWASFGEKVSKCTWITQEEIELRNAMIESGEIKGWTKKWPELSRDTGAEILDLAARSEDGLKLQNNLEFAADGLFCEWAWIIDLDAGTFEGYKGFNETPLTEEDRFYFLRDKEEGKYHGVKLVAEWSLDNLPTIEDFLAAFREGDEE